MDGNTKSVAMPLSAEELHCMDAWWRAANYLNIGQIYLSANPLLREELTVDHIKPRLLGHWGTSPGLNLIYVHLNRLIKKYDLDTIYMAGPGHGGPALIANVWLEGSYTEFYPDITRDEAGMLRLFRQFSTPGGVPSHVSVPTPGSIHEGGELGYVLVHAFGAVMDNPDLLVAAVVGDGEAETGPLAGSWKSIDFINPTRDGAVLPILHLNGYKISGPTVWARHSDEDLTKFFEGQGYKPYFVEGDVPEKVHQAFASVLETAVLEIREIQSKARSGASHRRPQWPVIVLRTPKGWTGPKVVDGLQIEGTFRAHQVPVSDVLTKPEHLQILDDWLRSYKPEELFDDAGCFRAEFAHLAPAGNRRMGSNPNANGGLLTVPLKLRDFENYQFKFEERARQRIGSTSVLGNYLRDIYEDNPHNFRLFCPDETNSNRLGAIFDVSDRCLVSEILPGDDHVSHDGRVMEVLSEHCCHGWLEGYTLTGRHGLFATYEAFAMIVDSMSMQHGKWLEHAKRVPWRADVPSLNYLLTSTCWRNDHNGFSHQGPGFIDTVIHRKPTVARVYLPADANCLLSVADHCLRSVNYLNLIVIDKQPQLQWLTIDEAKVHCAKGASVWDMYSNQPDEPDVVLACAGDIPTQETIAAAWMLRKHAPGLKVRVVNVVDLMRLSPADRHPHGMTDADFTDIFTQTAPVIFTFHGYPGVIHDLLHGRDAHDRFHVRGYLEEGTTTTPFDMVVLNRISRLHLCLDVLRYVPGALIEHGEIATLCTEMLKEHDRYIRAHFDDLPEIKDWVWSD
ncbi:phosphoketolase family protein [Rhizobium sp. VS19-DR104.2]|uniref:phosphoketolase family protein n=1 Tax=unclassified Rhizobium TaxID=2613769 RepID=UPI001CC5403A|nr:MULTISPECIES: phosphoketolase family protein [unclassified Rhizobium]MBZ5761284.1 phosphoketolase family protein [Rhizobium sp. VS19-DR96]MBZ5767038.1 phosphoketolase family protein [Rhizobium sp. VS19-DR129.2]MBZ5774923.1 phosphoketolase family protein [Rhizobium sp. VS19-DRK62.2]MBZ5785716.1 phosphoketolase family protein [Rhizobium sp. VS19-DR121]MBZ5803142.1 phosphoketolase family protein [Rhizobium sp. VS19-DR181]